MLAPAVHIRPVVPADETSWRELWAAYLAFYHAALPQATTDSAWDRIIRADTAIGGIVAEDTATGAILGIANYVLHPFTWSELPACLLHDLFVAPAARGRGAGRALIQHLIDRARKEGWARVYWVTREDNVTARTLYDCFTPADGFIRYTVKI
ncbi:MAG TPA: GNAT family N-acetyltransferase [Thermomicrobiales bacterium]|nr:GNAT family N-acetyltransferase [Thermomicrobiales bacterium]